MNMIYTGLKNWGGGMSVPLLSKHILSCENWTSFDQCVDLIVNQVMLKKEKRKIAQEGLLSLVPYYTIVLWVMSFI